MNAQIHRRRAREPCCAKWTDWRMLGMHGILACLKGKNSFLTAAVLFCIIKRIVWQQRIGFDSTFKNIWYAVTKSTPIMAFCVKLKLKMHCFHGDFNLQLINFQYLSIFSISIIPFWQVCARPNADVASWRHKSALTRVSPQFKSHHHRRESNCQRMERYFDLTRWRWI